MEKGSNLQPNGPEPRRMPARLKLQCAELRLRLEAEASSQSAEAATPQNRTPNDASARFRPGAIEPPPLRQKLLLGARTSRVCWENGPVTGPPAAAHVRAAVFSSRAETGTLSFLLEEPVQPLIKTRGQKKTNEQGKVQKQVRP